jgi:hypothetical protein
MLPDNAKIFFLGGNRLTIAWHWAGEFAHPRIDAGWIWDNLGGCENRT